MDESMVYDGYSDEYDLDQSENSLICPGECGKCEYHSDGICLIAGPRTISALKAMMEDEEVEPKRWLTNGQYSDLPASVKRVIEFADEDLISNGRPDFSMIEALRREGFEVTPGETDSFGWLTGVIHTPKGMIVWG